MTTTLFRLRAALVLTAALSMTVGHANAEPGVTADTITLGQTSALSGPLGALGLEVLKGSTAYFESLNAAGGIHGRKIKVVTVDDAYNTPKTLEVVKGFIAEKNTFAMFNTLGTPNTTAMLPLTQEDGMPVVAPFTGALALRKPDAVRVFNIRASYADEMTKLVEHLTTIGISKIAIAYQNNAFGKEALDATVAALASRNLKLVAQASIENDASDAISAADKLLASAPEALLLGLAGKPTIEVIRHVAQNRRGLPMYAMSVLATASNLKLLGKDGVGVTISQVMPFPTSRTSTLVRDYKAAMEKAGHAEVSHISLEGYVNARIMAEGLKRAGRELTRKGFVDGMNSIKRFDLGGFEVTFGKGAASASKLVELTLIDSSSRLIR